ILNRASMLVYAPRLEPFGFASLEANACATPVIAVAEGGLRETIIPGMNGLLVENDALAMAQAINQLRANPTFARQLGENGRKLVEQQWSLQAAQDRIEQQLLRVVGRTERTLHSSELTAP